MMRTLVFIIAIILAINCDAQLKLEISELYISSIADSSHFKFEDFEGPNISARCALINQSSDSLLILPLRDSLILSYYIDGSQYERIERPYNFSNRLSMILGANDTVSFSFSDNIFLGTKYKRETDFNYSKLLIEILPSLKVEYRSKYLPIAYNERFINVKIIE